MVTENSQRTMDWQSQNPEKYLAQKQRAKEQKVARQQEAVTSWKASGSKSPGDAIKCFCRNCKYSEGRNLPNMPHAPIHCDMKRCPLFPFRNGLPALILRGKEMNNLHRSTHNVNDKGI